MAALISSQYFSDQEILEKKMHEMKQEYMAVLSQVVHPKYLREFSEIFAYGFINEDEDAETLACRLNLNQLHALAILDRDEEFERAWVKSCLDNVDFI